MNKSRAKLIRRWALARWTRTLQVAWSGQAGGPGAAINPFQRFYRHANRYWVRHGRLPRIDKKGRLI